MIIYHSYPADRTKLENDLSAQYAYDDDGKRVLSVVGTTRTVYVNPYFEVTMNNVTANLNASLVNYPLCHYWDCVYFPLMVGGGTNPLLGMTTGNYGTSRYHTHPLAPTAANVTWRVYYPGGGVRTQTSTSNVLTYILSDHLGSTTVTLNTSGSKIAEIRYDAWGKSRLTSGTTPTARHYTGQYEAEAGLYFYNARWYDPAISRFAQADSIIPNLASPITFDRYAYANNNSIKYNDPSGHWIETALDIAFIAYDIYDISTNGLNWENGLSLAADVAGVVLPVVTGGGVAVRALMHADDAVKAINTVDNVVDAANAGDNLVDAIKVMDVPCSFNADTPVLTSEGEVSIAAVEIEDYVLA